MYIEERLEQLGIRLPTLAAPTASYLPCRRTGNLLFLSGQGTMFQGERLYCGRVGSDVSVSEAYQAARLCGINLLARLKREIGELDRVTKIVNLRGYVNSAVNFFDQPGVINGASDLMLEVFGRDIGAHSRTAVGVYCLPNNISVEIELVVEIS